MIAIISDHPFTPQKDGYLLRVREIEDVLNDIPRIYLHSTSNPFRCWPRRRGRNVYSMGLPKGLPQRWSAWLLGPLITHVYLHSLYNFGSSRELVRIWDDKFVIWDVHGIVPEEEKMRGSAGAGAPDWEGLEGELANRAKMIVVVSDEMARHLERKHGVPSAEAVAIPIFVNPNQIVSDALVDSKFAQARQRVIYAGGIQKWQRVDLVIELFRRLQGFDLAFYTNASVDPSAFPKTVELAALSHEEVADRLRDSHFSVVLRDDHPVNRVSCPTKLVDALSYGCLPIVLSKDIGDFSALGFQSIAIDQMSQTSALPLAEMAKRNLGVARQLCEKRQQGVVQLQSHLRASLVPPVVAVTARLLPVCFLNALYLTLLLPVTLWRRKFCRAET